MDISSIKDKLFLNIYSERIDFIPKNIKIDPEIYSISFLNSI